MDPNGHIYHAPEEEIPAEDRARLDGYLRGRAEAEQLANVDKILSDAAKAMRERGGFIRRD